MFASVIKIKGKRFKKSWEKNTNNEDVSNVLEQVYRAVGKWIEENGDVIKGLSYINQSSVIDEADRTLVSYNGWQLQSDASHSLNFNATKGKVVLINLYSITIFR